MVGIEDAYLMVDSASGTGYKLVVSNGPTCNLRNNGIWLKMTLSIKIKVLFTAKFS